jgi:uncharacterized protein with FMN-binding domain
MKKKIILIVGSIIMLFILIIGGLILGVGMKEDRQLKQLEYTDVDMNTVSDGKYTGIAETQMVKVTVEVTVKEHKISDIQITRHDNGMGQPAEVIVDDMIEQNRCDVDAVSGATTSSIVIKTAVHNALMQGIK